MEFFQVHLYRAERVTGRLHFRLLHVQQASPALVHQGPHLHLLVTVSEGGHGTVTMDDGSKSTTKGRYISIVLNGLQGVFIFVSFMCNKRVMHMYTRGLTSTSSSQSQNEATETATMDDGSKSTTKFRSALRFVHLASAWNQHV
ncbi:hypothetical protein Btru_025091 [Bulinus truncatus]|nr:hypothetical protein Btru_025091 [Bulinus truncatus]